MRTVAIIQARWGSARLPGKVLAKAAGKPLLSHMLERLRRCETLDDIVVATCSPWEEIWSVANDYGVGTWVGEEEDVLTRVLQAAQSHGADTIVELTGDCPLIDPAVVDEVVTEFYVASPPVALVSNSRDVVGDEFAYPRGMDVRVFPTSVLERVEALTNDPRDHEHVSVYIWEHPEQFAGIRNIYAPKQFRDDARLTVDEPEDLELVRRIFEHFAPHNDFSLMEILNLLRERPWLREINAHVQQKAT